MSEEPPAKTKDLDETIQLFNRMLDDSQLPADKKLTLDQKLRIGDRLLKAYALRLKYSGTGRGGAFNSSG